MKSKIRIAFLSVFYPFRGGIAQFNNELYKSLEKHVELVDIKAFNFSRQYPSLLFPGKTQLVEAEALNPEVNAEAVLDSVNPLSFINTIKKINEFKPDVVITSYWMPFFAPSLGFVLGRIRAKNKVALLHNVIPHEKGITDQILNKYYLNKNDSFLVLSDTVQGQLKSFYKEPKYLQVAHPLYRHFGEVMEKNVAREKLKISEDRKVLLFFGFIRKYKGLDLLIEAVSLLKDSSYTVLIAGESYEDVKILDDKLIECGIKNEQVSKHVEYIPDEDVRVYFSASDLCILPYRSATQSGIASIAKHFEIPMVVTPVGELPNEVSHLVNGYVCSEVSSKAIAEGVEYAMKNKEEFIVNQKQDNENNTFDNLAEKLIDFLQC